MTSMARRRQRLQASASSVSRSSKAGFAAVNRSRCIMRVRTECQAASEDNLSSLSRVALLDLD